MKGEGVATIVRRERADEYRDRIDRHDARQAGCFSLGVEIRAHGFAIRERNEHPGALLVNGDNGQLKLPGRPNVQKKDEPDVVIENDNGETAATSAVCGDHAVLPKQIVVLQYEAYKSDKPSSLQICHEAHECQNLDQKGDIQRKKCIGNDTERKNNTCGL